MITEDESVPATTSDVPPDPDEYVGMDRPLLKTTFYVGVVVFIIAFIVMFFCCSLARASAGDCEFIKNSDDRHLRATAKNQPSECEFIKDNDKRHICRAKFPLR